MGNQAALHLLRAGGITAAGDPLEGAAGRMAAEALRAPGPVGSTRVAASNQPLPQAQRAFFESRYGADLGHVRLHAGGPAADAAERLNARAFTVGSDIYLGARHTDVGGRDGHELLAHELAHVMQQMNGSVPADVIMRAQERGDVQAFIELLDGPTFNAIMKRAVGPIQWPVIREVMKGFAGRLAEVPPEQAARIVARFADLASPLGDFDAKLGFARGYGWGLVKGIFSPITDLFDLLKTAVDVQQQVLHWLLTQGLRALDGSLQADVADLVTEFGEVGEQVRKAIAQAISDPQQALSMAMQMADQAGGQALGFARQAGAGGVDLMLKVAEAPLPELGDGLGQVVGGLISEVVLAALSAGAANAARAGVRGVTAAVRVLNTAPLKALRMIGTGVEEVMHLVRRFHGLAAGVYSEVAGALSHALERLLELLKKLFNLPAEAFEAAVRKLDDVLPGPSAVTEGGLHMPVPNAMEARAVRHGAGGGAPRKVKTTVADLRPAAEVPKAPKPPKPKPAELYGGHKPVPDTRTPINPSSTKKPLDLHAYQNEIPKQRMKHAPELPDADAAMELEGPLAHVNQMPPGQAGRSIELTADADGPLQIERSFNEIPPETMERAIDLPEVDGPMELDRLSAADLPDADAPLEGLMSGHQLDGPSYQGGYDRAIDLPEGKTEAIYAMSNKEEMYYRAIEPGNQFDFEASTRRRFGLSRVAEDTGFDPKFEQFARRSDVGFDPKLHGLREVKSGPRTLRFDEQGRLTEWRTTKLTPKVRDAPQYKNLPYKLRHEDYGHLGGSQLGHLDAEFRHFGGARQPASRNRAVKGKGHPPWWKMEMKIKKRATALQNAAEDFEIVAQAGDFVGDVPTKRRIALFKVTRDPHTGAEIGRELLEDSGWLADRRPDFRNVRKGAKKRK